jgi:hypothetical protein
MAFDAPDGYFEADDTPSLSSSGPSTSSASSSSPHSSSSPSRVDFTSTQVAAACYRVSRYLATSVWDLKLLVYAGLSY